MRILITGGGGQLACDLRRALIAHHAISLTRAQLDVTDAGAVEDVVARERPDAVIHCAALTDTARCEREPELAESVNARGTEHVARACAKAGARLIAISTNEVFDGTANTPYGEDQPARAVNAYGRSKLLGEQLATAANADTLIVRTSWLYGDGASNFVAKVRAAASDVRPLRFVTDEVSSPTSTAGLARAIVELLERGAPAGIYHLSDEDACSRYDWAREILRRGGASLEVEPTTTAELRAAGYTGPEKPPYSALANTRARALGIVMPAWRDALAAHFARAGAAADA